MTRFAARFAARRGVPTMKSDLRRGLRRRKPRGCLQCRVSGILGARKFGRKFWAQGNLGASRNLGAGGNLGAESEIWAQD